MRAAASSLSAIAQSVSFSADQMQVQLQDGRSLIVPLAWFPALVRATDAERQEW
ncbi:MAG: DUF2442 domain-containing protein [Ktedonobacterales bacterium]